MTSERTEDGPSSGSRETVTADRTGVFVADTDGERDDAFTVRQSVFVDEQGVDQDLEYDEYDDPGADATHFVAYAAGDPIGAARLRSAGDVDLPSPRARRPTSDTWTLSKPTLARWGSIDSRSTLRRTSGGSTNDSSTRHTGKSSRRLGSHTSRWTRPSAAAGEDWAASATRQRTFIYEHAATTPMT